MTTQKDWIKEGLHFSCHQCGRCCTGETGYVWCTLEEMENLASFLKIDFDMFTKKYVRRVHNHWSLIEKLNRDCIFWDQDQGCTVYAARPQQCRTYPFWPEVIESKSCWNEEAKSCLGIRQGKKGIGKFHPLKTITRRSAVARAHDPLQK